MAVIERIDGQKNRQLLQVSVNPLARAKREKMMRITRCKMSRVKSFGNGCLPTYPANHCNRIHGTAVLEKSSARADCN